MSTRRHAARKAAQAAKTQQANKARAKKRKAKVRATKERKSLIEKLVASLEDGVLDSSEAALVFETLADDLTKASPLLEGLPRLALIAAAEACDFAAKRFRGMGGEE